MRKNRKSGSRAAPEPANPKPPFERIRKPLLVVLFGLIATFYFWTATSSNRPFQPRDTSGNFYNLLTDSLVQGHVYLPTKPPPQLLALPDPYDPESNVPYRLQDASLYHGRYYMYFGIAPAVVLYVPWRWLTGAPLSDDVAVTLFSLGGFAFSCLLLFLLFEAAQFQVPWFLQLSAVLALGLGQIAPIVLRRPQVYEVAVSAGYCFLLAGLYILARRLLKPDSWRWFPAAAAVCLGLAVASRPQFAIVAVFVTIGYGWYLVRSARRDGRSWMPEFARFAVPLIMAAVLIGWYNYARFDNPMEFGIRYQVGIYNYNAEATTGRPMGTRLRFLFASLYYALLCPPDTLPRFPFFDMSAAGPPFGSVNQVPETYYQESVAGVIFLSPLCMAALLFPFLCGRKKQNFSPVMKGILGGLLVAGFAGLAAISSMPGTSARYGLDYVPVLLIAGLFFCVWLCLRLPSQRMRTAAVACTVVGCAWSVALNMALSVNSYGYPLEQPYSPEFRSVASSFGAGPDAFARDVLGLHLDATIRFPHAEPGVREAILTSGLFEQSDLLFVEYKPQGQAVLLFAHNGEFLVQSPAISMSPGTPHRLTVTYSAADKSLVVALDQGRVLGVMTTFYPTSRDRVILSRVRVPRYRLRDFSGRIDATPEGLRLLLR